MSGGWTRPTPMHLDLEIDRGDNKSKLKDHQGNNQCVEGSPGALV